MAGWLTADWMFGSDCQRYCISEIATLRLGCAAVRFSLGIRDLTIKKITGGHE
jgi:hypothetical protein